MKQEIDFVKFNPTQNMTILVRTKHPPEQHRIIASTMMSYDHLYAEQVGFIEVPHKHEAAARLRMAGGEFCGNACMALGAYLAAGSGLIDGEAAEFVLETSGAEFPIVCRVRKAGEAYACQVAMPIPSAIEQRSVIYEGDELPLTIIRYEDFFHIVIEVEQFGEAIRRKAQGLAQLLGIAAGDGLVGILLFKPASGELAPLIYVPPLNSMVWERGCGSGTASLGAYLAWKNKSAIDLPIRQPGGTIHVTADCDSDRVTVLHIEGTVGIVAEGTAFIEIS